jgi:adenine-specific DNA-methyltransferase
MPQKPLLPKQALNKAFLKVKPNRSEIDRFKQNLVTLLDGVRDGESEEFHKNLIRDFLNQIFYSSDRSINTRGKSDLVIHNGRDTSSSVGVILEVKRPTNQREMVSVDNLNAKAFQELVLYFLRERIAGNNLEIRHLVITNLYEWFIFDAAIFEKVFAQNMSFVKQFTEFDTGRLTGTNTDLFYREIAKPFIAEIQDDIPFTRVDLREFARNDDRQIISLFKLFSPEHLLKLPFANDSNRLDRGFYHELLYIIGLTEVKEKSKKLIQRKTATDRSNGSLLENTIDRLENLDKISRVNNPKEFGETKEEITFSIALALVITWINRILFLKLLEAQLVKYHGGDRSLAFLNETKITNYDDLDYLFFGVLALQREERSPEVREMFDRVPYLNSSLFEPTKLEQQMIVISNLRNENLPIFSSTVLKDSNGRKRSGDINTLQYVFEFLDAYDFSSEGSEDIQEENKTLINASVLGLIFEKINGYKDGSFFTPGFITMYMCRETIRRSIVQKFNEIKGWNCQSIEDLYDKIEDKKEANQLINSLKICDPAVGSGHFLVSTLNEMIAVKSELKVLLDRQGKMLRDYPIQVINDELIVIDDDGSFFEYHPKNKESQRVQEALFHEKQTIIENCLFGVDINDNSVKICRLRLWIELLKNAYYKTDGELETLPNIDINIKCGNSLISRFPLDSDLRVALKKSKRTIEEYKNAVQTYRNAESKDRKREMEKLIDSIKGSFRTTLGDSDPKKVKLRQLESDLYSLENQLFLISETKAEQKAREKKIVKLQNEIDKLRVAVEEIESGKIYDHAFEWRFEFPEVLNDSGDFIGFDVVIGNPPWGARIDSSSLQYIKSIHSEIIVRMIDSFMFFINLNFSLNNRSGIICQIIPDVVLYQVDNEKLREIIFQESQLAIAINLGDRIFEDVARPSCILLMTSDRTDQTLIGDYSKNAPNKLAKLSLTEINTSSLRNLPYQMIATKNLHGYQILNRYQQTKLEDVIDKDGIQRGISPDLKEAFIVNDEIIDIYSLETHRIFPTITGGWDMEKYRIYPTDKKIIYTARTDDPGQIPAIVSYISQFRDRITCSEVKENKHPFWSLHRPRDPDIFRKPEKIIGVITGDRIIVTLDSKQIFPTDGLYVMSSDNERCSNRFLWGVLNSKLLNYFYRLLSMEDNRTLAQIKPVILNQLPIEYGNAAMVGQIEISVDRILTAKQADPDADTIALEEEIDRLVYELYGLTEAEIAIVENS